MSLNFLLKRSGTASKRPDAVSMALGEIDLNYNSDTGGVYYKDSAGNVVKVGPCQVSVSEPNSTPAGSAGNSVGEFWYDIANQSLQVWNGSAWVDATSTASLLPLSGGTMSGDIVFAGTQSIPVSSIESASTSQPGVVQLNDTTSSTSTTEALTANQGKELQTQINALSVSSNILLAGTIDAATGNLVTVTSEGTAAGFTVGSPLPSPVAGNDNYFVIVTTPGTMTPPGGSAQECHQGDWWLSDGTAWVFLDVGFNATAATTSTPGVVQLATDAEVQAGSNSDHAVTSSGLQSKISNSTSTTSSTSLASSTAAKSAYDAGIQGQTDAAAAQATADAAMPKTGGTFTGSVTFAASTVGGTILTLDNLVSGSGYDSGSYDNEPLTGGTGAGATANITTNFSPGGVVSVVLVNGGSGYTVGDTLSAFGPADDPWSIEVASVTAGVVRTVALNGGTNVDGDFTFNTSPTFSAGLIDCASSCGTAGQVLMSNGANAVCWGTAGGGGGGSPATPTVAGIVFGYTDSTNANAALGLNALASTGASAGASVAVGADALACSITGVGNVAVGYGSLAVSVDGQSNVSVGTGSMSQTTSGSNNVAMGTMALSAICTSCNNVSIGDCSMFAAGAGDGNVALGAHTLCMTSGCNNVAIGVYSSCSSLSGIRNVTIGPETQVSSNTGSCQLAIGFSATDNWITGTSTKAIKPGAGVIDCANSCGTSGQVLSSTGTNAVRWIAAPAGALSTPTTCGTVYGLNDTTNANLGSGFNSGGTLCGTSASNSAIGINSMYGLTSTHCCNVALGQGTLFGSATNQNLRCNVVIGVNAGCIVTSGSINMANNVYIGTLSGSMTSNTCINTAVGYLSQRGNTAASNTSLGALSLATITGPGNIAIGIAAGGALTSTAACNILIGYEAGNCPSLGSLTGSDNVLIGRNAQPTTLTGSNQLALGIWLRGCSNGNIKPNNGILDCAGSAGTAGQVLMSNGANAVCWGTAGGGGSPATPTVAGVVLGCTNATSTALGCNALLAVTTETVNVGVGLNAGRSYTCNAGVFVGASAGCAVTAGLGSVAIGANAGGATANPSIGCNTSVGYNAGCKLDQGHSNTLIGWQAGLNISCGCFNTAVGHQALVCVTNFNSCSTAVGYNAGCSSKGTGVTSIGACTGQAPFNTGNFNTILGYGSGGALSTGHANVIIGSASGSAGINSPVFNVSVESNRFVAGSTAVTNAYVQVAWTVVSDARDKTNITALPVGLEFVNKLNPVSFQFRENRESDIACGPLHYGFLAQEVLAAEGENPVIIDTEKEESLKMVNDHLNAVFVKAIQELSAKNDALEARIATLEGN